MKIIRFSELVEIPWRNGGGITREIAHRREGEAIVWRLSMADVGGDGPFSDFAGLTRILTVIDGAGLRLSSPDGDIDAPYARPVTFDGATPITATLRSGPIRDLNLMFDPGLCSARVDPLHGPLDTGYPATFGLRGIHCLRGVVRVGDGTALSPGDTVLVEDAALPLVMDDTGVALLIIVQDAC